MFKKTLIAAALAVVASGSMAQVYVQGALGKGNVNVDWQNGATDVKNSNSGSKFIVGYSLGDGWSVEGNMINYGKSTAKSSTDNTLTGEFKASGYGIGGAYTIEEQKWLFRTGFALNSNKLSYEQSRNTPTENSWSNTALNLDLGIGYKVTDSVAIMAGYDFSSVKRGNSTGSVSLLSFGVRAKF